LVNFSHPAAELDAAADAFAQRLASGARRALQWTKATVNVGLKQVAASVLETGAAYEMLSNQTGDHAEAVAAFRAKREPVFGGD
jgi:enoyl-CoA hydratase